jgi:hypothetical protein
MQRRKLVILVIALLALLIPSSLLWYQAHYSMTTARSFDVGTPSSAQHVLIATQGSLFKDALVAGITKHLSSRPIYISVIDVSKLPNVRESDWDAIVLIHTWEYSKPQTDAKAFIDRLHGYNRIVVVATSGSGKASIPGVDVISAASVVSEVPTPLSVVTHRLDELLKAVP